MDHTELVVRAEKWLNKENCKITIRDECRIYTTHGEQPDVIGWRDGVSILLECKTSRSDFLADKNKPFRMDEKKGMGDWRFYVCTPDIINIVDLPRGWGLLWVTTKMVKKIHGYPGNIGWVSKKPFLGNKECENMMLVSVLRRIFLRGDFNKIYEKIG